MKYTGSKLQRFVHTFSGHNFDTSVKVTQEYFKEHPHNDQDFIYIVAIRKCECGILFLDSGMTFRDRSWIESKPKNT